MTNNELGRFHRKSIFLSILLALDLLVAACSPTPNERDSAPACLGVDTQISNGSSAPPIPDILDAQPSADDAVSREDQVETLFSGSSGTKLLQELLKTLHVDISGITIDIGASFRIDPNTLQATDALKNQFTVLLRKANNSLVYRVDNLVNTLRENDLKTFIGNGQFKKLSADGQVLSDQATLLNRTTNINITNGTKLKNMMPIPEDRVVQVLGEIQATINGERVVAALTSDQQLILVPLRLLPSGTIDGMRGMIWAGTQVEAEQLFSRLKGLGLIGSNIDNDITTALELTNRGNGTIRLFSQSTDFTDRTIAGIGKALDHAELRHNFPVDEAISELQGLIDGKSAGLLIKDARTMKIGDQMYSVYEIHAETVTGDGVRFLRSYYMIVDEEKFIQNGRLSVDGIKIFLSRYTSNFVGNMGKVNLLDELPRVLLKELGPLDRVFDSVKNIYYVGKDGVLLSFDKLKDVVAAGRAYATTVTAKILKTEVGQGISDSLKFVRNVARVVNDFFTVMMVYDAFDQTVHLQDSMDYLSTITLKRPQLDQILALHPEFNIVEAGKMTYQMDSKTNSETISGQMVINDQNKDGLIILPPSPIAINLASLHQVLPTMELAGPLDLLQRDVQGDTATVLPLNIEAGTYLAKSTIKEGAYYLITVKRSVDADGITTITLISKEIQRCDLLPTIDLAGSDALLMKAGDMLKLGN